MRRVDNRLTTYESRQLSAALSHAIATGKVAPEDIPLAERMVRAWVHGFGDPRYTRRQGKLITAILKAPPGGVTSTHEPNVLTGHFAAS